MTDRARPGVVLVLGAGGQPAWSDLSPTDWVVLQALALGAEEGPDGLVAPLGVRRLGAFMGLSKNTVTAAVGRLAAAGLVARLGRRPGASTGYRISLPAGMSVRHAESAAGGCPNVRDDGRPIAGDTDGCPGPADNAGRPSGRDITLPSAPDEGTCPDVPDVHRRRLGPAVRPAPSDIHDHESAVGPSCGRVPETLNGSEEAGHADGSVELAVSRRAADGHQIAARSPRSGAEASTDVSGPAAPTAAHNGSQGQLFDLAVTAGSQDPRS